LVQISVDPKTRNLDKTAHDILQISELVMELMPAARIQSIDIRNYFAIVRVLAPQGYAVKEAMIRLYQLKDEWKIRGCTFSRKFAFPAPF
jgi:hypothetical protein